ncbi:MAG: hypothetical protein WA656_15595, partial [Pseudolabrys sp.]
MKPAAAFASGFVHITNIALFMKGNCRTMRVAAINSPQGKIFGVIQDDSFRPFSISGASVRDLRHVIRLLGEGTPP